MFLIQFFLEKARPVQNNVGEKMKIFLDEVSGKRTATFRKPICTHEHVRQGGILKLVAPMVAKRFRAAIIMPNTDPPITERHMVQVYRDEILQAVGDMPFIPMMTLYLTDLLESAELDSPDIFAVKYYPRGLTTNSDSGVKDPASLWTPRTKPYEVLRAVSDTGRVLILHAADGIARGDVTIQGVEYRVGEELDPYDQERHFIYETLPRIRDAHPKLKCEVAHLSTSSGVSYMRANGGPLLGCSLTAHHLLLDRRDVMRGGFRPHRDWRPVIQPKVHRDALRDLATARLSFVWLGKDSAPHVRTRKESDCCATGVLTAHAGIELYAEVFDELGALDERFENFASVNASKFYNIPSSDETLSLTNTPWTVRKMFWSDEPGGQPIVPFRLGEEVQWQLVS